MAEKRNTPLRARSCFPSSFCLSSHPPAHIAITRLNLFFAVTSTTCQSQFRQIKMTAAWNRGATQGKGSLRESFTCGGPSQTYSHQLFDGAGEDIARVDAEYERRNVKAEDELYPKRGQLNELKARDIRLKDSTLATLPFQPYKSQTMDPLFSDLAVAINKSVHKRIRWILVNIFRLLTDLDPDS